MIIKEANRAKIEALIKEAEGRATARKINFDIILKDIEAIETELDIPKKAMTGITATIDPHNQNFPNAYRYRPESTHYKIIRKASGWNLEEVYRDTTRRRGHRFHLVLTPEAKAAVIDRLQAFGN